MNNREIKIEEITQGCILSYDPNLAWENDSVIVIRTKEDAQAVIESLQRMIKAEQEKGNPHFI